jgi:hypothetical protein
LHAGNEGEREEKRKIPLARKSWGWVKLRNLWVIAGMWLGYHLALALLLKPFSKLELAKSLLKIHFL